MNVFVRAVITGFGFSLGKALFDQFSDRIGFKKDKDQTPPVSSDEPEPDLDRDHAANATR